MPLGPLLTPDDLTPLANAIAAQQAVNADVLRRLAVLEAGTPVPPPPPPTPSTEWNLLGGRRIQCFESTGRTAVDHVTGRLWCYSPTTGLWRYDYDGVFSPGADPTQWDVLVPAEQVPKFWPVGDGTLYPASFAFFEGKLWTVLKSSYDTSGTPALITLYAQDGEQRPVNLIRQSFGGFVKGGANATPRLGGGGREPGSSSTMGPTLATMGGQTLLGPWDESWSGRCPRSPDYASTDGQDSWWCQMPRGGEGRWTGVDSVYGGGLVIGGEAHFWACLVTGQFSYELQSVRGEFWGGTPKTTHYRFDATTGALLGFEDTPLGAIAGHEIDPQGRKLLCELDQWKQGAEMYPKNPVVRVYG